MKAWKAPDSVIEIIDKVQKKYHPLLEEAGFAICFTDGKAFVKERFNWGKTSKVSPISKLFQTEQSDFLLQIPAESWGILNDDQKEALIDLHLCRCKAEMMPVTVVENGKKHVVKDDLGRTLYSDEMKYDEDGDPKWIVLPFDLGVLTENVSHYGCWCQDLKDFADEATTTASEVVA